MDKTVFDLYTDYLLCSFGSVTATGLSQLVDGAVSHDQITRLLASEEKRSAHLWQKVKPLVRQVQRPDGVLIIDDSVAAKPYTDENELICWHWDNAKERNVKGINFVSAVYHVPGVTLPVAFDLVTKTETYYDPKARKEKRRSAISKNARFRTLVQCPQSDSLCLRAGRLVVCLRRQPEVCGASRQKAFCDALEKQSQSGVESRRPAPGAVYNS